MASVGDQAVVCHDASTQISQAVWWNSSGRPNAVVVVFRIAFVVKRDEASIDFSPTGIVEPHPSVQNKIIHGSDRKKHIPLDR